MHWLWRAYQETRSIWVKRVKHGRKQLGMSQKTFFRQFHNGVVHISSDTRTMVSCTSLQTLAHWCRAHLFRHSHTGVVHISSGTCTLVSCTSLQTLAHWCRAHLFRHSHTGIMHIYSVSAATCTVTFVVDMCSCMQLDLCYGFELQPESLNRRLCGWVVGGTQSWV